MKRASLIRIKYSLTTTLDVANDEIPYFYNPLHYHPELELTLVERSSGIRIVGDSFEAFGPGDLVLVGSQTPHIWKNEVAPGKEKNAHAKAIVIKFLPDFAGSSFWQIPEMQKMKELVFDLSPQGVKIEGKLRDTIAEKMQLLIKKSEASQIISLLEILSLISDSGEYRMLSKFQVTKQEKKDDKVNTVISFLQTNYQKTIQLEKLATKACMHKNSLCQYFKRKTGKTIFEVLHEIRLKQACDLLIDTNESIEMISSQVGYFSQTLFNRKFKEICGTTPLHYRKMRQKIETEEAKS